MTDLGVAQKDNRKKKGIESAKAGGCEPIFIGDLFSPIFLSHSLRFFSFWSYFVEKKF
jgi:hypothetical protein